MIVTPLEESLEAAFAIAKKIKPKHKLSAEQMDKLNEERFERMLFEDFSGLGIPRREE